VTVTYNAIVAGKAFACDRVSALEEIAQDMKLDG